jgi:hypothetical protein
LYYGASDINFIEQERKSFDRTDFSDREYDLTVTTYNSSTLTLKLSSIDEAEIGDVVVQIQSHTNAYNTYDINVEAIITAIDAAAGTVTVGTALYDFIAGPITLYKAFQSKVLWAPDTMDGQGTMKQIREAILRMKKSRVSTPYLGFSSNLQPSFEEVPFIGPGLGLWGYFPWSGVPWGGDSNQRAFRTYVPLQKQRCSMLNVYFRHKVAREQWQVEGLALVYEVYSTKVNR